MKKIILILCILTLVLSGIYAQSGVGLDQQGSSVNGAKSEAFGIPYITLDLVNSPVDEAIKKLLVAGGISSYDVQIDHHYFNHAEDQNLITKQYKDARLDTVLDDIISEYNLYAIISGYRNLIIIRSIGVCKSDKHVTVDFRDTLIQEAIEIVFKGSGLKYAIAPEVKGSITLKLTDVGFSDAVTALRKADDLIIQEIDGVYTFAPKSDLTKILTDVKKDQSSTNPLVQDSRKRISVNLMDVPLKDAIDTVFKTAGYSYTLSPAINSAPYDKIHVSMKFENVTADGAIAGLLTSNNLMSGIQDNTILIMPMIETKTQPVNTSISQGTPQSGSPGGIAAGGSIGGFGGKKAPGIGPGGGISSGFGGNGGMPTPNGMQMSPSCLADELVTMSIPSMPVKDAVAKIEPGWTFKEDLGNTIMPGAKFSGFQKDMAIALVLSAAMLAPPTGYDKVVTTRGKIDLSMYQWMPAAIPVRPMGIAGYIPTQQAIAIGMCKNNGKSLFTILAVRAPERDLLEKLMSNSGYSYLLGDMTFKADASWHIMKDAIGNNLKQMWRGFTYRPESQVSVQLYNVTLDEALNSILPMLGGVKFRKQGPAANPTYYIESQYIGSDSSNGMPLKDKNEKIIGKVK